MDVAAGRIELWCGWSLEVGFPLVQGVAVSLNQSSCVLFLFCLKARSRNKKTGVKKEGKKCSMILDKARNLEGSSQFVTILCKIKHSYFLFFVSYGIYCDVNKFCLGNRPLWKVP